MTYRCSRCGRNWNNDIALENELECTRKCGGSLIEVSDAYSPGVPDTSSDLDTLPSLLAIPLHEFANETNPVLALWHACDFVELALRLAVAIGLADLARSGPLPDDLSKALLPRFDEPTMGKWQGMAEAVGLQLHSAGLDLVSRAVNRLAKCVPTE